MFNLSLNTKTIAIKVQCSENAIIELYSQKTEAETDEPDLIAAFSVSLPLKKVEDIDYLKILLCQQQREGKISVADVIDVILFLGKISSSIMGPREY
ncbi:MAG: hypothetical protein F6K31_15005 [Symploca sp. SIO2G7]|nr:hypothetical protein [Symploca sp. SIO2G7]